MRRPNAVANKKGLTPVRPQSHSMHVAYLLEQLSLTLSGEHSVTRERAERVNAASYAFFQPNLAVFKVPSGKSGSTKFKVVCALANTVWDRVVEFSLKWKQSQNKAIFFRFLSLF